jgi:hypothetical protein
MAQRGGRADPRKPSRQWRQIIDECVGKALANSFRQQILWIFNERVATQSDVAKELGEPLNRIGHHVKVLKDAKCIEVVGEKRVGNRVQLYYKATSRAFLDNVEWQKVPDSLKEGLRATLLSNVIDDSIESLVEGVFDSDDSSHLSWTPLIADEKARAELAQVLERALREVMAIQDSTKERLAASGEAGMSFTVSILGHPSTGGEKRVGPPCDVTELAPKHAKASKKEAATKKQSSAARKATRRSKKRKRADQ